jgi:hypothetical protein
VPESKGSANPYIPALLESTFLLVPGTERDE